MSGFDQVLNGVNAPSNGQHMTYLINKNRNAEAVCEKQIRPHGSESLKIHL